MHRRKAFRIVLIILLLAAGFICPAAGDEYATLEKGMSGPAVLRLKQSMYYLGYFTSLNLSDSYNDVMVERVKNLQRANGLEEDGIASAALQELVYSGRCLPTAGAPAPTPVPTPVPPPLGPSSLPADLPETTQDGFLAEDGEYLYENPSEGLWICLRKDLAVTVRRYASQTEKLIWFETDIRCSPDSPMLTYVSEGRTPGKRYVSPVVMAEQYASVLAITDDFFGHRLNNNERTGVVIRNGRVIGERTYRNDHPSFPNLEVLALFADGSMKCFLSSEYTAQEYLSMGVTDTFAFGPILVTGGEKGPHMDDRDYYHYREPRCALGMIEPYHYVVLTVKGRADDSKGTYLPWLADRMLSLGAVEAMNLDGGGTVSLVFNGKMLNKGTKNLRNVTSMIGFGGTPQQLPE